MKTTLFLLFALLGLALAPTPSYGARAQDDTNPLLLLHFDGSLAGVEGEAPVEASGLSYRAGVFGQAVTVDGADVLRYAAPGDLNAAALVASVLIAVATSVCRAALAFLDLAGARSGAFAAADADAEPGTHICLRGRAEPRV